MKKVVTVSQVVVMGGDGKPKFLSHDNKETGFKREVEENETIIDSVNHTFEHYRLDTTDLEKILVRVDDESEPGCLNVWYRLEVDPISLLEFLVGEGRDSGLELIDIEG
jgi:hypothetical protein